MIESLKQNKVKFKPRIKLTHNIYIRCSLSKDPTYSVSQAKEKARYTILQAKIRHKSQDALTNDFFNLDFRSHFET